MRELTVDETRAIQVEITEEIDRICRKLGITYFLGYGSLLGALRHGGFIPWDDDMDIMMLRADYERFAASFASECKVGRFSLASWRDRTAPNAFLKVTDTSTWVEERYSEPQYGSGVWVDIFPLDRVGAGCEAVFKRSRRLQSLRYLIVTNPSTGGSGAIRAAKRIVCPFAKMLDPFKQAGRIDDLARRCNDEFDSGSGGSSEALLADIVSEPSTKRIYPERLFEQAVGAAFEGRRFFVPSGAEEVLDIMYGNWRELPPESEREMHTSKAYSL